MAWRCERGGSGAGELRSDVSRALYCNGRARNASGGARRRGREEEVVWGARGGSLRRNRKKDAGGKRELRRAVVAAWRRDVEWKERGNDAEEEGVKRS